MRGLHLKCVVLMVVALAAAPGCVELTGQRVSWFHDAEKDELLILIHYDGIHEASTASGKGADQIPEFVNSGDIMFLDWPFHLEMADVRRAVSADAASGCRRPSRNVRMRSVFMVSLTCLFRRQSGHQVG